MTYRDPTPYPYPADNRQNYYTGPAEVYLEAASSQRHGIGGWWLNLTAPPPLVGIAPLAQREHHRKAELTSFSILAVFLFLIALVSNSLADPSTGEAVGLMAVGLIVAAIFNRSGKSRVAAYLITMLLMLLIMAAVIEAKGGLRLIWLPAYDLLALPVFISGLIIGRRAPWFLAFCSIAFIVGDFLLQPHDLITTAGVTRFDDIHYELGIWGVWGMINRPIGLIAFAALFGWLGARSVDWAMIRLDRAEETARLEHAYAEQSRQLQYGVQQILATHVRIANGDLSARAPLTQDNVLWQIAASLNNMVERLRTSTGQAAQGGRAAYQLSRTEAEAQRLAQALRDLQQGRQPIWPQPTGTVIDQILAIVRPQRPNVLPSGSGWGMSSTGDRSSFPPGSQSQAGMFPNNPSTWAPPFTPYPDATGPLSDSRMRGLSGLGQGYNTPGQDPPGQAYPVQPSTSSLGNEENWPSLDIGGPVASANSSTAAGSSFGRQSDPFPPLDNPWYLPPDEE